MEMVLALDIRMGMSASPSQTFNSILSKNFHCKLYNSEASKEQNGKLGISCSFANRVQCVKAKDVLQTVWLFLSSSIY